MALTGLDIYKLLPKTNCKECGFATCLAFAMALAQKKVSLDKCPHITAQAKLVLESASQPPIKLIRIGEGENALEMGNETVLYRHEQKFFHPAGIGFLIEDTLSEAEVSARVSKINNLRFERVGQNIAANLICVRNVSDDSVKFANIFKKVAGLTTLNLALASSSAKSIEAAIRDENGVLSPSCRGRRPLIICENNPDIPAFAAIAKACSTPLAISASDMDEAAHLVELVKRSGVDDIVINLKNEKLSDAIQDFTFMRRAALKKNFRPLGYPLMAFASAQDPHAELAEAISYVLKYAGLVIIKNIEKELVLPLLVARQDIYSDPQKPVQVEPRIYEIGKVGRTSPVLVTTNFSITYFTVAGEVEASKVPSYIVCCDCDGMSVLTAWAAEKFTPEKIDETVKRFGVEKLVSHKKLVIPGYVAVMSGALEELMGWKISAGPREASGIPYYLRNYKA